MWRTSLASAQRTERRGDASLLSSSSTETAYEAEGGCLCGCCCCCCGCWCGCCGCCSLARWCTGTLVVDAAGAVGGHSSERAPRGSPNDREDACNIADCACMVT